MAGLWSLDAMDKARNILHQPLFNPVGVAVLYGALVIHLGLAFYAIYRRRRLQMPLNEALQLILGLCIPLLLINHILGTRIAFSYFNTNVSYQTVLLFLAHFDPYAGFRQALVLFVAWTHGCIGLYFWLRLKPWYPRALPYLFGGALLVPVLSALGYWQGAKDLTELAADPKWVDTLKRVSRYPGTGEIALMKEIGNGIFVLFGATLVGTLILRLLRAYKEKRQGLVQLIYDNGRRVQSPPGGSLLDFSRSAGVPHASVCGGRGRCSTCRVRILKGAENLADIAPDEQKVLDRVKAGMHVRLACQAHPMRGEIEVARLLPATADAKDGFRRPDYLQGKELQIAVLFADLRAFTKMSEKKLPYDVVFILNRYFESMGSAVSDAGGYLDKFIGDGVMALFGIESGSENGCRAALTAAKKMGENIAELNKLLENDLEEPLRIGVGIHVGPVIVGEMGYGQARGVTAIGDTVNTASRLESMTKEYGAQLIVSSKVAEEAKLDATQYSRKSVDIRGRTEALPVYVVPDAAALAG